jgi:hypothetical protein
MNVRARSNFGLGVLAHLEELGIRAVIKSSARAMIYAAKKCVLVLSITLLLVAYLLIRVAMIGSFLDSLPVDTFTTQPLGPNHFVVTAGSVWSTRRVRYEVNGAKTEFVMREGWWEEARKIKKGKFDLPFRFKDPEQNPGEDWREAFFRDETPRAGISTRSLSDEGITAFMRAKAEADRHLRSDKVMAQK